jgi:hypothetical protein
VFDGEALTRPNTLASAEAQMVKDLNGDRAGLVRLCAHATGAAVEDPVCVGVDQDGIYVRARFGVLRIHFPHTANDPEHAGLMVGQLLKQSG